MVLTVNAPSREYPIYIEDSYGGLAEAVRASGLRGSVALIVTDTNVAPLYEGAVKRELSAVFSKLQSVRLHAGEEHKNLNAVSGLYQKAAEAFLDRESVVFALGGGVVGDTAGFFAATFMRGLPFVQLPTTLLSCVDSSVGGKTGVDFAGWKNLVGAFYQPRFVYINSGTLATLPRVQFNSGMGEVIKHGLIRDAGYYNFVSERRADIAALEPEALKRVIEGSCRIKAEIVGLDEKESGLREILNFGHTFGHALESASNFKLPHGLCVMKGCAAAMRLGAARGELAEVDLLGFLELARFFGMEEITGGAGLYAPEKLAALMRGDKKARGGAPRFVLLERVGAAKIVSDIPEEQVKAAMALC
ncbi:MAG: 3-dehydroquinate synthase [Clostridiales bacterium]|nr:3-dehydroquinate synthase [Clostridiales bacterium]